MKAFWKKRKNFSKSKQPSNKIEKIHHTEIKKLSESIAAVKKVEQPYSSFGGKEDSEEPYYIRIKKSEKK
jgi:hypothetical protein